MGTLYVWIGAVAFVQLLNASLNAGPSVDVAKASNRSQRHIQVPRGVDRGDFWRRDLSLVDGEYQLASPCAGGASRAVGRLVDANLRDDGSRAALIADNGGGSGTAMHAAQDAQRRGGRIRVQVVSTATEAGKGAASMVIVAEGPFLMGCNESVDPECDTDEKPGRMVNVAAFAIDKTEVTVAQYAQCVDAGACSSDGLMMPFGYPFGERKELPEFAEFCNWHGLNRRDHPINCVDWNQAVKYCTWAGKRLPSEAEWEKAARGADGRRYSWGNAGYGASGQVANVADESLKRRFPERAIAMGYDDGYVGTAPVGSFPAGASPSGALDMIGNVAEWTADVAHRHPSRRAHYVRGEAWLPYPGSARVSARQWYFEDSRNPNIGFRCAR